MRKLILFMALAALATGVWGESIFALYGMSEQNFGYDVYSMGAGDTGWADLFRLNLSHGNPALAVTSNKVNFSGASSFGYMNYSDESGATFRDDGINFPYVSFTMPWRSYRFGLHFASVAAGNVANEHERTFNLDGDYYAVEEKNTIFSSVYRANLLVAMENDFCNVGVALSGYMGQDVHNVKQNFDDSDMMDTQYETARFFDGVGFTVGLARRFGDLAASVSYSTPAKLEGDIEYTSIFDTEKVGDTTFELPSHIGAGLAWRIKETFKACLDMHYETWADTDTYADPVNTYKLGLGLSYDPLWGYGEWYERIPLRVGAGYRILPFKVNGSNVTESMVSFGVSAPLRNPGDQIHFAVQYILRGDKTKHGVEEKTLMFSIGATGFDIFKARTPRTAPREIPKPDRY